MLEDRDKGVVYVPVSAELLNKWGDWSDPVQFRFERIGGEPSLVFRKIEWQPVESSQGRAA